ncbi:MAG: LacI family DNA-binding transcriptional regulator [Clostridiales Family XIII bacterium]|jgi:LacI family transcriptional regulator|nr:LacI family DNA-binding transcriptional regulator [Clostridiales Family XIII bacterium]
MVNIREIAKRAEVSPSTVSRVLNRDPKFSVSEETKDKIYRICNELNYIPRKYKNNRNTKSIGIISSTSREAEVNDPYYRQIREKLAKASKSNDYYIDFMIHLPYLESYWHRITQLSSVIVIGYIHPSIHERLYSLNKNIIIVDDFFCSEKYSSVSVNFYKEMLKVLDMVYDMGHREIAFIAGRNGRLDINNRFIPDGPGDREKAYLDWMKEKQLPAMPYIGQDWYAQDGYDLTDKFLKEKDQLPTLIIAASDMLALGIMRRLSESSIKVPEEVSICSFDNLEIATFLTPSLTTFNVNINEMIRWIIRICTDEMIDKNSSPTKIVISGDLVMRESLIAVT